MFGRGWQSHDKYSKWLGTNLFDTLLVLQRLLEHIVPQSYKLSVEYPRDGFGFMQVCQYLGSLGTFQLLGTNCLSTFYFI